MDRFVFPAPLAVGFHRWADQTCPLLHFSCFLSIKWDTKTVPESELWGEPNISSVLLAGTKCGVVTAYKVLMEEKELIDVCPLSLIFAHPEKITSMIRCESQIYRACAASLSNDGTICLISIEDLTVLLSREGLFAENSRDLAAHGTNRRLMIAIQGFGSVEIADIYEGTIIQRISGFSSILTGIISHGPNISISCCDGAMAIFSVNEVAAECLYAVKNDVEGGNGVSVLSPDFTFVLTVMPHKWVLYDSSVPLFERKMAREYDSYVKGAWVSADTFYVYALGGRIELWKCCSGSSQIFSRMECRADRFYVVSVDGKRMIEPVVVSSAPVDLDVLTEPPILVQGIESSAGYLASPVGVTLEGYFVTSPGPSVVRLQTSSRKYDFSLAPYFKTKYRCRCAIGDPIRHEARVSGNGSVYVDRFNDPIGRHDGAFQLFAPPANEDYFFTFSVNGSVFQWEREKDVFKKRAEYFDFDDPVQKAIWIESEEWVVFIGQKKGFSVMDPKRAVSLFLCSGHDAPIVEINFSDGLFTCRCESSSVYTWNTDGELCSKTKLHEVPRLGHMHRHSPMSCSEINLQSQGLNFSRVVPLLMPNCQTFAVVFDVIDFLDSCHTGNGLSASPDLLLPARLLWNRHLYDSDSKTSDNFGLLTGFEYAVAGDAFKVTLPISLKSQNKARERMAKKLPLRRLVTDGRGHEKLPVPEQPKRTTVMTRNIAFHFSPLLSAVHSVASASIGHCVMGWGDDDARLSLFYGLSLAKTTDNLATAVTPSFLVLANWLSSTNESLRTVVVNVLHEIIGCADDAARHSLLMKVYQWFSGKWTILLPIVFLLAAKTEVPKHIRDECGHHMLPYVLNYRDIMELLAPVFSCFVEFCDDLSDFFLKVISPDLGLKVENNVITSFAIECPIEYFDVAAIMPNCVDLTMELIRRIESTARNNILQLLTKMMKTRKLDFSGVIAEMARRFDYVYDAREYVVFGEENGHVSFFLKKHGSAVTCQEVSSHPITAVSASPTGKTIGVLVAQEGYTVWISRVRRGFDVIGKSNVGGSEPLTRFMWDSEKRAEILWLDGTVDRLEVPKK